MKSPGVSVVMNCFNSAEFLREAIDSVLAQTFSDFELVFWDNQSTDGSAAILASYTDDRIRYYYAPQHTGLGEARNLAVAEARGEWIGFLDCDDLWHPEKLEKQIAGLASVERIERIGIINCGCEMLDQLTGQRSAWNLLDSKSLPEGDILEELLIHNSIPLLAPLIRRSAFHEIGGIPSDFVAAEDYYLFVEIAARYSVLSVNEILCTYRVHGKNSTFDLMGQMADESRRILEKWGHCITDSRRRDARMAEFDSWKEEALKKEAYTRTRRYRMESRMRPVIIRFRNAGLKYPLLLRLLRLAAGVFRGRRI